MTTLRPTVMLSFPAGLCRKASHLSPGSFACPVSMSRQQPGGVQTTYGSRRHLRISQRRRRIEAAKWGLFVIAMVFALGPAAVAVWAWGQYMGAW